ncbi:hypothetical protein BS78_08G018200 [Paspalum vaginatum]|nr:hypothetical protein BS78_08G018200 [Paspalum vaginatum]
MKLHNSRYLSQSSTSDHPSFVSDHRPAMKEIARGQSLVTQLRAIVLPALQADCRSELVAQMFQSILDCSSKAITELQLHHELDARGDGALVDDKKRGRGEEVTTTHPHRQLKRRKSDDPDLVSLETPVPHYDGRQWRKYGQKHINKTKYPRSYYRCTYRQDQDCKATKTVQQQDDSTGTDHPLIYTVIYHGQHTCKDNNGVDSGTNDYETNTQSSSDSRSSKSTTCTDPDGYGTTLDDNKLLDRSADLITEKDLYEPFDLTAFGNFDLDSWELDALLRFGA